MTLKQRLARLQARLRPGGACPACHYRPDDVRTLVVRCHGAPRPEVPPDPRPPCPVCRRPRGAIRIVEALARGAQSEVAAGEGRG